MALGAACSGEFTGELTDAGDSGSAAKSGTGGRGGSGGQGATSGSGGKSGSGGTGGVGGSAVVGGSGGIGNSGGSIGSDAAAGAATSAGSGGGSGGVTTDAAYDALAGTSLLPSVAFSVDDQPVDGAGDTFNAAPFTALISKTDVKEDRALVEFDGTKLFLSP